MIILREHQVTQKTAIREWVRFFARSSVPAQGARGTLVSATGSGKTITAAASALECFPHGRILVMVPTLDLIVQSAQTWRRAGHRAPMVAVCSVDKDEVLEELGVRTTTNPIQLALWAGSGPVVVFATYASLVDREDPADVSGRGTVPGPLESALAGGGRLFGQRMAPFDLAILDEGHMTAGDMGRPWAAIHDQSRIPVDFRLYLTATPRILAAPRPQRGRDGREVVIASMDDDSHTYGNRIFDLGLAEAVERSILAGFEIDVLEIRDPDPILGLSEDALRGRRMALLQAALLEHAAQQNLHTTMVFHQRVEEAAAFAEQMPRTASELYTAEASAAALAEAEELPASSIDAELYELEEGRHVPADRVWADWLCGDHPIAHRREVIHQFANGIDAHNRRVHRAFLSSVRALGVGVDITGLRGVEAVCIVGSRSSQVDVVQNIGRALRPNPDGRAKTARIIIPVFLQPGEDPKDMLASASYQPLVDILQALRSHSERLIDQLASHALARSTERRRIHVRPAPAADAVGAESEGLPEEAGEAQQEVDRVTSIVVNFASPRDAADIAALTRCRVIRPQSLAWLEGYQALVRWRAENGITGLHAVPYDIEIEVGRTKAFPLGRWVHQQRKALRADELDPHRKELLNEAGMVWEPGDEAWEKKLAALRSYRRATGHLAPRQDAVWGEGAADGEQLAVGQLLANLRRKGGLGKDAERATARAAQLAEIDPDWNCPWPLDWQRHYKVLADLAADEAGGVLPDIQPGVLMDGDDIGRWLQQQRKPGTWKQLSTEQQERLSRLGVQPTEAPSPAPAANRAAKGPSKAQQAFKRGVAALAQYIDREGKTVVGRPHVEELPDGTTIKLGVFLSNQKARRDRLDVEQRAVLAELGYTWAAEQSGRS
ncbi:helicase [Streptomyces sp. A0642]|uniref:DEAD/DEAH box helicase n=1 Tax=Streptomyces sp. A0642 TaxID=2563100 RepID=UPI0010A22087|nr:DEAD/DEAH box helicase [Streptomyces sp. A0642]THA65759.1 helicase [Streptomyces sp. A0642]